MSIPLLKNLHNQRMGIIRPGPDRIGQRDGAPHARQGSEAKPSGRGRLAAGLAFIILISTPGVAALEVQEFESFDSDTVGLEPSEDWYTFAGAARVADDQSESAPNSLKNEGSTNNVFLLPEDFCSSGNGLSGDFYIDAFSGGSALWGFYITGSGTEETESSNPLVGFTVNNLGVAVVRANGVTPSPTDNADALGDTVILVDTWYRFTLSFTGKDHEAGCGHDEDTDPLDGDADDEITLTIRLSDGTGSTDSATALFGSSIDPGTFDMKYLHYDGMNGFSQDSWIDNLEYTYQVSGNPRTIFCADAGNPDNFGWDYVEGVDFVSPGAFESISMNDYYQFRSASSPVNSDYAAKAWDQGTRAVQVTFTIEAADEGEVSSFRVAFTTGAHELLPGASGDTGADNTAASDGEDGGNFDNTVQVRFDEDSAGADNWRITFWQNVAGSGLTQRGQSFFFGNPNVQNSYIFRIDSTSPSLDPLASLYVYGSDIPIKQESMGFPVQTFWEDQWFIGKGTGNTLISPSITALDNNDAADTTPSTCIYDLVGEATIEGDRSQGSTANNETAADPFDPPAGGAGGDSALDLIESPYFWVLFWILLINVILAALSWGSRAGFGGMVYGTATLIIYIFGVIIYGIEKINPWPIAAVLAFVIGMAIWSRWK